jgi:hypothetical protein
MIQSKDQAVLGTPLRVSGGIVSLILSLVTTGRLVVSFRLYPRGKGPPYALNRGLSGPQFPSGRLGKDRNLLPLISCFRRVIPQKTADFISCLSRESNHNSSVAQPVD